MEDEPPTPTPRSRRPVPPTTINPVPSISAQGSVETPATKAAQFHYLRREAVQATTQGQNHDAGGNKELAFKAYEKALQYIDDAVSLAHQGGFSSNDVDAIDDLTIQMRLTRKNILERISDLQGSTSAEREEYMQGPSGVSQGPRTTTVGDLPPAYSEIASPGESFGTPVSTMSSYSNLAAVLNDISNEQAAMANPLPINAREVFSIPENVQIYFISSEDNVSAPTYPSFLRLVVMEQEGGELGVVTASVPAFLQVGDWSYPLIPSHSPVFRSTEGIYMFPDLTANVAGSYVGLLLPMDCHPDQRKAFEEVLLQLLGIRQFPGEVPSPKAKRAPEIPPRPVLPPHEAAAAAAPTIPPERRLSTKIAEGLITGAEALSRGLLYGANKTSTLLDKGAAFIQTRIDPAKEKTVIKPEYRKGMKTAKTVTGKAVQVSGYVVTQVGRATLALGRHLAPHVHKAGTKILAKTVASDEVDASTKVDQMMEVTAGAVYGFGTVYMGLENAAKVLASSLADNTVQIVQHRYGEETGEFAGDTVATAGNAAMTAWNAKSLAPKSIAKRAAKDTGKIVLENHAEKRSPTKSPKGSPESGDNKHPPGGAPPPAM